MNPNHDSLPTGAQPGPGATQRSAPRWPSWLKRGPLEIAACVVIALGIFMMLQPFALVLYTWSFATTLAGVAMFTIVSKFPK
jgi:hypothetical protein